MTYRAEVILDSLAPCGERLTTMELVMPRCVLAEFNTYRKNSADHGEWVASVSSNAGSSRAIPVMKSIAAVRENPYIPVEWGKNRQGMVATELLPEVSAIECERDWLVARDIVVEVALDMAARGVHKQIVNRLLEPWAWVTVISSATEWGNLLTQRCNPAADPAIQKLAYLMLDAYTSSKPKAIPSGTWHMPYLRTDDYRDIYAISDSPIRELRRLSVARCARVSYLTHRGVRDPKEDIRLFGDLLDGGHWSPFEHVAVALEEPETWGNFRGWRQLRKFFPESQENIETLPQGVA